AEKWTNTSSPSVRSINPYPFSGLNHYTLPSIHTTSLSKSLPSKIELHTLASLLIKEIVKYDIRVNFRRLTQLYSLSNKNASDLYDILQLYKFVIMESFNVVESISLALSYKIRQAYSKPKRCLELC